MARMIPSVISKETKSNLNGLRMRKEQTIGLFFIL